MHGALDRIHVQHGSLSVGSDPPRVARHRPPTLGPRLPCPVCGEHESVVLATRGRVLLAGIWRRRACCACGARFSTREVLVVGAP